jgi:hypothetical protein
MEIQGKSKLLFFDDNHNGVMDSNETVSQIEVSSSQDVSRPPSSMDKMITVNTDANGTIFCAHLED